MLSEDTEDMTLREAPIFGSSKAKSSPAEGLRTSVNTACEWDDAVHTYQVVLPHFETGIMRLGTYMLSPSSLLPEHIAVTVGLEASEACMYSGSIVLPL